MNKEVKIRDIKEVEALKSQVLHLLEILRLDDNYNPGDYHIIFLFLIIQKEKMLLNLGEWNLFNVNDIKKGIFLSLPELDIDTEESFKNIQEVFRPIILSLKDETIYKIVESLKSLNQVILRRYFAEIFDDLLYKLVSSHGRTTGEFFQPIELSRFVCSMAELPKNANVYNPFAGLASFAVCIEKSDEYLGQELNSTAWALGYLRIMAHNKMASSKFIKGDSITDWNPTRKFISTNPEEIFLLPAEEEKFDLIISSPPYGMRPSNNIVSPFGNVRSYEHFLIERGIESLKPSGKLVVIISQGFLLRAGSEHNLRKHLIENDLLEMVISFPGGLLMNTGIAVAILVINKNKFEKGTVRFIDAKQFVKSVSSREKKLDDYALSYFIRSPEESDFISNVSNETIRKSDFNLNPQRYLQAQVEGVTLNDLASIIRGHRNVQGEVGKFVRIKNLKEEKLNYEISLNEVEENEIPRNAQKISESCLLLATRWKTIKPTYFHFAGDPIYITPDIIALKIDEKRVDIGYLINELHADYVNKQIETLRTGMIPYIRKEDLLSIKIILPAYHKQKKFAESIKEQRAKIAGATEAILEEKKKEAELFLKIHGYQSEILEQNAYLRHSLAGTATNLKGSIEALQNIILNQVVPLVPQLLNFKVSPQHSLTLATYINIIERDINKIVQTTSRVTNTNNGVQNKELYQLDIYEFLEKYCEEKRGTNNLPYVIEFSFNDDILKDENGNKLKILILANIDLLTDLLDNLILNASQHAFPGYQNNRIEIFLMLDMKEEKDVFEKVTLLVSNTGKTFPEDYTINDFIRKGSTSGDNGGEGFGGWYINEIIKYFNGTFDIIDEQGPEGLPGTDLATSFEIVIPINQIEADESI